MNSASFDIISGATACAQKATKKPMPPHSTRAPIFNDAKSAWAAGRGKTLAEDVCCASRRNLDRQFPQVLQKWNKDA